VLQWWSLALFLFAAAVGLCASDSLRYRSLLVTLVIAGAAGPLATVSVPRLSLPMLGLLLPAAGLGLTKLWRQSSGLAPGPLAMLAAGCLLMPVATLRQVVQHHLAPSSHYSAALTPVAALIGAAPTYADLLACEPREEAETLRDSAVLSPGTARWLNVDSLPASLRTAGASAGYLGLAGARLEAPFSLTTAAAGAPVQVIAPERWQHVLPVAGTSLSCSWEGGVLPME
jgi:hypothetical protein